MHLVLRVLLLIFCVTNLCNLKYILTYSRNFCNVGADQARNVKVNYILLRL